MCMQLEKMILAIGGLKSVTIKLFTKTLNFRLDTSADVMCCLGPALIKFLTHPANEQETVRTW